MARREKNASRIAQTETAVKQEEDNTPLDLQGGDEDKKKELALIKKEEGMAQELDLIRQQVEARRVLREMRNQRTSFTTIAPFTITVADEEGLDINYTVTRAHHEYSLRRKPTSNVSYLGTKEESQTQLSMGFASDQLQCITADYNPYMPSIPGRGWLFFGSRRLNDDLSPDQQWNEGRCRVIARIKPSGRWLYLGHYEMEFSSTLTIDEWQGLPEKVGGTSYLPGRRGFKECCRRTGEETIGYESSSETVLPTPVERLTSPNT
ncbi:hypothetical protein AAF712_008702 [Marasmius tenuissimus]|uniref:DUF6697 domain-containing protein n=1 Tax=Marasmius tenuissimus TaxID=585030 RepID=A0ABR2ZTI9_9AGAR